MFFIGRLKILALVVLNYKYSINLNCLDIHSQGTFVLIKHKTNNLDKINNIFRTQWRNFKKGNQNTHNLFHNNF